MGKPTGFLIWGRQTPHKRSEAVRVRDCDEFVPLFDEGVAREQGGRCMDCGVPFCMQGCPLGNRIPDWNDLVHRGDWWRAWVALDATNNFPEFTGRLCPAPCEAACVLAVNQDPVTIELIEKQVVERAFAEGWVVARPPRVRTGKSVGVVGSGPAGLAAAVQLNRAGHQVVVYERADRLGGLLRYGIPDFKLDKAVIDRRLDLMRAEGVRFEVGVEVGRRVSWAALRERHDALVVAIGAEAPRELEVPGRELAGVHLAMDYLGQHNRRVAGDPEGEAPIVVAGERVVVLGGGDTGSDCVGTAHRQGAASVVQLELLPAPPAERPAGNPWPQWPLVLRTSSSHEEGGERLFGLMTRRLAGDGAGRVAALHAAPVDLEAGPDGRTRLVERPGAEEVVIPCDRLILALGFVHPVAEALREQLGVALDARGGVATGPDFATSALGVFAAGDARRGASLIVWAISEGREAAREVDHYLRAGAEPVLPTRGQDRPFGGR